MFNINFKNKSGGGKGISLYFGLIIMAIFLAVALGLTTILIGQMGIMKGMGDSVVAFYAADTGIEKILAMRGAFPGVPLEYTFPNGATYIVTVTQGGTGGCAPSYYFCLKSIGSFRATKRAIEITY